MGEYYIEMLFNTKVKFKNKEEDIREIFDTIIDSYQEKNNKIKYVSNEEEYIYEYDINKINKSLYVSIKILIGEKERISINKIEKFQEFKKDIQIKASKKGLNSSIVFDNISIYYIKKLIPEINKYEWSLRRIIYLILNKNLDDMSIEEAIPEVTISDVKERENGLRGQEQSNILQLLTMYEYENFLFGENYIDIRYTSKEEEMIKLEEKTKKELIESIVDPNVDYVSNPYSIWEKFFQNYTEKDLKADEIKEDMVKIRGWRNDVSHNKEIDKKIFIELNKLLEKYINEFISVSNSIISGAIKYESLETTAKELRKVFKGLGVIAETIGSAVRNIITNDNVIKTFKTLNSITNNLSSSIVDYKMNDELREKIKRINNQDQVED